MRSRFLLALAAVLAGTACGPGTSSIGNPYLRGPDPTEQSLTASAGPYAITSSTVAAGSGFGGGTLYYPTEGGPFAGVAVVAGMLENQSAISWLGPRLASRGFVVITVDANSALDQPIARGDALLAALDYLTGSSAVRDRVDAHRLGVVGHSAGGGGALVAAAKRPELRAVVPLTPWDLDNPADQVRAPTLVVAAQRDWITSALPFYHALPASGAHAYLELRGADHLTTNSPNGTVARYAIAWLKRFLDGDTRYDRFLCPPAAPDDAISDYQASCPLT